MCVTQLSGRGNPPVGISLEAGGGYAMPARTAEELRSSTSEAADNQVVDQKADFKELRDPTDGIPSVKRQDDGPMPWVW